MTLLSTSAQAVRPPRSRRRRPLGRYGLTGWGFVGPFVAVFALVFLAPIGYAAYLSLFRDRMIGGRSFVGMDNYQQAVTDPQFWEGLGRVGLFLAVQVPIMLGIALLVALAIDSGRLYGRSFFRVAVFLPYAVPAVVASLMWGFIYGTQFGLVGNLNDTFGLSLPDPLSPSLVLASIGNIVTWEFVGYNMLIFYSALKVVPRSLYEAAAIDGAWLNGGSSPRSSSPRSAVRWSSPRSSPSSAASSCSTSPASCRSSRPTRSPTTSPRTSTRTRCPSPDSSTTTPRPWPS